MMDDLERRKLRAGWPVRYYREGGAPVDARRCHGSRSHGCPFEVVADGVVRGYPNAAAAIAAARKLRERRRARVA